MIKDLLTHLEYRNKDQNLIRQNPEVVFNYTGIYLDNGIIEP